MSMTKEMTAVVFFDETNLIDDKFGTIFPMLIDEASLLPAQSSRRYESNLYRHTAITDVWPPIETKPWFQGDSSVRSDSDLYPF